MAVWLVRAGKGSENEQAALDENLVMIGWNDLPDLSGVRTRDALADLYQRAFPEASPARTSNHVGKILAYRGRIKEGDHVILPLKRQASIAIGKVTGPYIYRTDLGPAVRHARPVEWLRKDLPRTSFDQDRLYSFWAFMAVCQIKRNNVEERIQAVLEDRKPPQPPMVDRVDIDQAARDQIQEHIQRRFAGHRLADLVEAVLQAEGYLTRKSPPGPDGGVDILAGSGPMGFGTPRLCVQVKSSPPAADVSVLRERQGILQGFQAENGLLVCWGGFKNSVHQEARHSFFKIRLWDAGDILQAILKNYERLPNDLQAELPLKRIWALVLEE